MKKIVNVGRIPVIIDTETLDILTLDEKTRGIDSVYVIPEDAKLHWTSKDKEPIDMDVKKDSILITFYNSDLGKNFVVLESEDWKNMLLRAEAEIQKRKENWAADHTCACEDCPRSL